MPWACRPGPAGRREAHLRRPAAAVGHPSPKPPSLAVGIAIAMVGVAKEAIHPDDPSDPQRCAVNDEDDDLLVTMSHELRAPLHAILGWVQLLRAGGVCGPEAERALEIIERNARNEAKAVDEAIDLARITSRRLDIRRDELRLVEALRAALAGCEPLAKAKRVHIDVHADPDVRVRGDLGRLAQTARGLVSSAVRRSVSGGTVQVRLARDGASGVLSIREDHGEDDGSPRTAERNTARHRRLALIGDGRGMSVAVARGLVRLHGGTVEELEDGALIVVRLPAVAARRASAPQAAAMR